MQRVHLEFHKAMCDMCICTFIGERKKEIERERTKSNWKMLLDFVCSWLLLCRLGKMW